MQGGEHPWRSKRWDSCSWGAMVDGDLGAWRFGPCPVSSPKPASQQSGPLPAGGEGSACCLPPKPAMMSGAPSSELHPPWKPCSLQLPVRHDHLGGDVIERGEGDRCPPSLVQVQILRACGCLLDLWEVFNVAVGSTCPWLKRFKEKMTMSTMVLKAGPTSKEISVTNTHRR